MNSTFDMFFKVATISREKKTEIQNLYDKLRAKKTGKNQHTYYANVTSAD